MSSTENHGSGQSQKEIDEMVYGIKAKNKENFYKEQLKKLEK